MYFGLNHFGKYTAAKIILILASLYFYAFFNWSYLPIIISSIIFNFLISKNLYKLNGGGEKSDKSLAFVYRSSIQHRAVGIF